MYCYIINSKDFKVSNAEIQKRQMQWHYYLCQFSSLGFLTLSFFGCLFLLVGGKPKESRETGSFPLPAATAARKAAGAKEGEGETAAAAEATTAKAAEGTADDKTAPAAGEVFSTARRRC